MQRYDVGLGRTGIGDNFAKSRLLLAKRAGYISPNQPLPTAPGASTDQWRRVSKNLAANSRKAGFPNPMMYLRAGASRGGAIPPPVGRAGAPRINPFSSLAYAQSAMAMMRTMQNPFPGLRRPPMMGA